MKYYSIQNSLNSKIVGIYPQVQEAIYHCDVWDDPKFVDRVNFVKTNFEPITADAILRKKAKLTDFISASIIGFNLKPLISGKLKEIIQKHKSSGLQFYQARVIYKDDYQHDYWVLNPYEINTSFVDIKNSKVVIRRRKEEGGTYLSQIDFNSTDDFIKMIKKEGLDGKLYITNIKIKENVNDDFFTLLNVDGGVKYIVSEKLKAEIELYNCTGIEFMPVELSLTEWLHGGERERVYGKSW